MRSNSSTRCHLTSDAREHTGVITSSPCTTTCYLSTSVPYIPSDTGMKIKVMEIIKKQPWKTKREGQKSDGKRWQVSSFKFQIAVQSWCQLRPHQCYTHGNARTHICSQWQVGECRSLSGSPCHRPVWNWHLIAVWCLSLHVCVYSWVCVRLSVCCHFCSALIPTNPQSNNMPL